MDNVIHVHIFEPHKPSLFCKGKKSEPSQLHIYTCEHKESCDAYKNGTCINVGNVFGARCPVGKKSVSRGFTARARKYYDQIVQWKETYKDAYHKLNSAPKRVTKVYGGWMLPYSHMAMNEDAPFKTKEGFFSSGCPFVTDEDMTKETIDSILGFTPYAMMGGAISSYHKEVIPKFIHDFKVNYPSQFNEFMADRESVKKVIGNMDYVGRKAFLKTIKTGVKVKLGTNYWDWDGKKISRKDVKTMIFEPCTWESCHTEYVPDDKATVKITSNDQVDNKTLFAD